MKKNILIVLLVLIYACNEEKKDLNPVESEIESVSEKSLSDADKESTKQIVIAYLNNEDLDRDTFVKTVKPKVDDLISNSDNEGTKTVLKSIVAKMQKESNPEIFSIMKKNLKEQISSI